MDVQVAVVDIRLAIEKSAKLEVIHLVTESISDFLERANISGVLIIIREETGKFEVFTDFVVELRPRFDHGLEGFNLLECILRALGISPEIRSGGLLFKLLERLFFAREVKDSLASGGLGAGVPEAGQSDLQA
jgi:hypothetical protein